MGEGGSAHPVGSLAHHGERWRMRRLYSIMFLSPATQPNEAWAASTCDAGQLEGQLQASGARRGRVNEGGQAARAFSWICRRSASSVSASAELR